jgi:hypothetical protein
MEVLAVVLGPANHPQSCADLGKDRVPATWHIHTDEPLIECFFFNNAKD